MLLLTSMEQKQVRTSLMHTSKKEVDHPHLLSIVQNAQIREHRHAENVSAWATEEIQTKVDAVDAKIAVLLLNVKTITVALNAPIDLNEMIELNVPIEVNAQNAAKVALEQELLILSHVLSAEEIPASEEAVTLKDQKDREDPIHAAIEGHRQNQAQKETRGIKLSLIWQ